MVVTGANRHDVTQPAKVLPLYFCMRCGRCAEESAQQVIKDRHYIPHVKQRREEIHEKKTTPDFRARRWVVEVTHSWFNRFRKLLVRYEKLTEGYEALLHMAAAIINIQKNWCYLRISP